MSAVHKPRKYDVRNYYKAQSGRTIPYDACKNLSREELLALVFSLKMSVQNLERNRDKLAVENNFLAKKIELIKEDWRVKIKLQRKVELEERAKRLEEQRIELKVQEQLEQQEKSKRREDIDKQIELEKDGDNIPDVVENKMLEENNEEKVGVFTIDIEPTWESVLGMITPENFDVMKPELFKMAKIADLVRQAQKHGDILVLYPNGKVVSTKDLPVKKQYFDRALNKVMPCNTEFQEIDTVSDIDKKSGDNIPDVVENKNE